MKHKALDRRMPSRPPGIVAGAALVGLLLCWLPPLSARADLNFLLALTPANPGEAGRADFAAHFLDAKGAPLNTAQHSGYILRFEAGDLPPARAFWSITLYDGRTQLLVDNPIGRHMIVSPMLPQLERNPDGSLTLYIQHASPGAEYESNWLPAPDGPFYLITRIHMPKPQVIPAAWKAPLLQPVSEGRAVDDER